MQGEGRIGSGIDPGLGALRASWTEAWALHARVNPGAVRVKVGATGFLADSLSARRDQARMAFRVTVPALSEQVAGRIPGIVPQRCARGTRRRSNRRGLGTQLASQSCGGGSWPFDPVQSILWSSRSSANSRQADPPPQVCVAPAPVLFIRFGFQQRNRRR